ncbi:metal ABC transporter permease [Bulleidia sp. zg-1006]|uniref:metal ABC transporter permease n=1 Tax=Bulleidia sp. zg-1006 TaxID=2806552 RepID=UPI00193A68A2|nr:metal ABC transporter permease [Bulleidia sp. zg-1006]QRG86860.1 metal ABC transporter permease [Bulleidia sp. zg-1006]
MMEVLLVILMTSLACAILGPFLVLQKLSMTADALSHSVLLGIVVAFMYVQDLNSPWLFIGAALFGLLTVYVVETVADKYQVKKDDALGIIFPMFFSLAVILISRFFRNAHLDVDIVLMGNPLFAPFIRLFDLPRSFVVMLILFILNLAFVLLFYQPLKITSFDPKYARLKGIKTGYLFYGLMTLTSLTTVTAFDSVGAILVISFLVAPAACACLVTKDLKYTLIVSLFFAMSSSILGFALGNLWNVSIAGMCSFIGLLQCILVILFHKNGWLSEKIKRSKQRKEVYRDLFLMHVYHHPGNQEEIGLNTIQNHLNWSSKQTKKIIQDLLKFDWIVENETLNVYELRPKGLKRVTLLMENLYDQQSRRLFKNYISSS